MSKHRATGNPRGRPPKIQSDFGQKILMALRRRADPATGLVRPLWKQTARELGVSRSTIARQMVELRKFGAVESVIVHPKPNVSETYYRLKGDARACP